MKLRTLCAGLLLALGLLASVCAAQTTAVTGVIKDLAGNVVPSGQVTFVLKPSVDTTISGNARFTPQTVTCGIYQAQNVSLSRAANAVSATFPSQPGFVVGDILSVYDASDATFNGVSAFAVTSISATAPWTVTWNQTAANSTATGAILSALRSSPGPGTCTIASNTALTPAGTYYAVTLWPNFAPTASFDFYALSATVDLSTIVPTPAGEPTYPFAALLEQAGSSYLSVPNQRTTGTLLYTLTKLSTDNPSSAVVASTSDTGGLVGIAISGVGTDGDAVVQLSGQSRCSFDGATTAGDYVTISSTTGGDCHDAGSAFPTPGPAVGRVLSTNAIAGTYGIDLFPAEIRQVAATPSALGGIYLANDLGGTAAAPTVVANHFGATQLPYSSTAPTVGQGLANVGGNIAGAGGPLIAIANNGVSGTIHLGLTKLTGAPSTAVVTSAGDTGGIVGVTISASATTGTAIIQTAGTVYCIFDGATVAGDYVQNSATIGGACQDTGSSYPAPGSGQVIGRSLSTNGSAGTYQIDLYPAEIDPPQIAAVQTFYRKNLAANVILVASTLQPVDSVTVNACGGAAPAFPCSGGPFRVQVCYSYFTTAGSGVYGETYATDGSDIFASDGHQPVGGSDGSGYHACGFSTLTYTGSSAVPFTVEAKNSGGQTIATSSSVLALPGYMTVAVMGSH